MLDVVEARAAATHGIALSCPGPEDAAYIIFTSGSTGRPKGCVLPHRGLQVSWPAVNRHVGSNVDHHLALPDGRRRLMLTAPTCPFSAGPTSLACGAAPAGQRVYHHVQVGRAVGNRKCRKVSMKRRCCVSWCRHLCLRTSVLSPHAPKNTCSNTISFDAHVLQLFPPLVVGATLIIAKPGGHLDPGAHQFGAQSKTPMQRIEVLSCCCVLPHDIVSMPHVGLQAT